ncbi:Uridine nucleosidase 1 [Camellia lanceoleosa]|uniref:Uridine nucleosidase 1 n=1 Tax=Camellia lanceoleosa TaxID=1840588 RepID=A0ACC0GEE2_9ERIC|nr:Uridine nucleosidase 1 [Camellia lanceoleosa]
MWFSPPHPNTEIVISCQPQTYGDFCQKTQRQGGRKEGEEEKEERGEGGGGGGTGGHKYWEEEEAEVELVRWRLLAARWKQRRRLICSGGQLMASVTPNEMGSGKLVCEKIIIDTDPGIDDSVAIFMAFQTPQLEVLGLTTIFGNVTTEDATRNALILGGTPDVAYFIHGSDGLGNTNLPPPKSKKIEKTASEFLVDMVSEYPGQVSIVALGPLTNLALAVKKDSSFASKVKRVVILGGSFFALGNVNPAAETNIYGDPEAADIVFTSGANIVITGINITRQVIMTDADLDELRQSEGRHAQLLSTMCKCYRDWHVESLGVYGIFLHDPVSFVALVRPDLFTYKGVVRVGT